jgi:hypothetical protein
VERGDRSLREKEEQVQNLNRALAEAERQSINALAQTSEVFLLSNRQLEALVTAIQAGKQF